eukprot:COSAG01_NODE_417_length_17291_cov_610.598825_7_plen_51_part_00
MTLACDLRSNAESENSITDNSESAEISQTQFLGSAYNGRKPSYKTYVNAY